jgi:hypothetical protein
MERGRDNRTVQTRVARPTAGVGLDLQCQQALPWLQRATYDKRHSGPNQQEMQDAQKLLARHTKRDPMPSVKPNDIAGAETSARSSSWGSE